MPDDNDCYTNECEDDDFLTKQDLRDGIDDLHAENDELRAMATELAQKNQAMTMDLIRIAATLGAPPDMVKVMERIDELLKREQGYLHLSSTAGM